jgi:hypothetical protein
MPACVDMCPEENAETKKLKMVMGTENGGTFIFDPVLKAQDEDPNFLRFNYDPNSIYFKEGGVALVQWLPKQTNLAHSASMSQSRIQLQSSKNQFCVVYNDGSIFFYNADEKESQEKIIQASNDNKEACITVQGTKVPLTTILTKMQEIMSYDFDKEYQIIGFNPPKIDLDSTTLEVKKKNQYTENGCLVMTENLFNKRRANVASCHFDQS